MVRIWNAFVALPFEWIACKSCPLSDLVYPFEPVYKFMDSFQQVLLCQFNILPGG
jgi:hypothetical protein